MSALEIQEAVRDYNRLAIRDLFTQEQIDYLAIYDHADDPSSNVSTLVYLEQYSITTQFLSSKTRIKS